MMDKTVFILSLIFVFGMAIVALAFNSTSTAEPASVCCSSMSESCPLKRMKGHHDVAKAESCCAMPNCCCKGGGDSCPMRKRDNKKIDHAGPHETAGDTASSHSDNFDEHKCCTCCDNKNEL